LAQHLRAALPPHLKLESFSSAHTLDLSSQVIVLRAATPQGLRERVRAVEALFDWVPLEGGQYLEIRTACNTIGYAMDIWPLEGGNVSRTTLWRCASHPRRP